MNLRITGIDLILIVSFIVAGIPLMLMLMLTVESSKMNYLEDKTVLTINYVDTVTDIDGKIYPRSIEPIHIDYGGAMAIAAIQDDYCPTNGNFNQKVYWRYYARDPAESVTGNYNPGSLPAGTHATILAEMNDVHTRYRAMNGGSDSSNIPGYDTYYGMQITKGFRTRYKEYFNLLANNVGTNLSAQELSNEDLYLVWNRTDNCWVVTSRYVNIFK